MRTTQCGSLVGVLAAGIALGGCEGSIDGRGGERDGTGVSGDRAGGSAATDSPPGTPAPSAPARPGAAPGSCGAVGPAPLRRLNRREYDNTIYNFLGIDMEHHDISHLRGANPIDRLAKINNWHAQQLAYLIKKLKSIPEGNGSVFDNTLIMWFSEIGYGASHSRRDTVFTLAGGKGYLKTGRYLKFSGRESDCHSRLLLHFLRYMGLDDPTFGAAKYCAGGPLANLTV